MMKKSRKWYGNFYLFIFALSLGVLDQGRSSHDFLVPWEIEHNRDIMMPGQWLNYFLLANLPCLFFHSCGLKLKVLLVCTVIYTWTSMRRKLYMVRYPFDTICSFLSPHYTTSSSASSFIPKQPHAMISYFYIFVLFGG